MKIIETKEDVNGIFYTIQIDDENIIKSIEKGLKKRNKIMKKWCLKN
jgi:hypothetical protein